MAQPSTEPKQFVSVSRLQKFDKCGEAFNLHYNHQLYLGESSDSLTLGTIVHEALDHHYNGKVKHPVEFLDTYWPNLFEKHELQHVALAINTYKQDMAELMYRCSADCTDKSQQIRNSDGGVPSPKAIGPGSRNRKIAAAWEQQGFEARQTYIDKQVAKKVKGWENVSISTVYARAYELLENYGEIPGLTEVLAVEMGFSQKVLNADGRKVLNPDGTQAVTNAVTLPISGDYFTGKVDLIAMIDGAVAIIDHKTSRGDPPGVLAVMYHDQLLMYAWAYEQLFKERPYYIGINHLRSGQIVLAPINWDLVEQAVQRFDTKQMATKGGHYGKRGPFEYNSPCLNGAKGLEDVTSICPYLHLCYPQLYGMIVPEAVADAPAEPTAAPDTAVPAKPF